MHLRQGNRSFEADAPKTRASMGTPKGCFGADDKLVLASCRGCEAYTGGA